MTHPANTHIEQAEWRVKDLRSLCKIMKDSEHDVFWKRVDRYLLSIEIDIGMIRHEIKVEANDN